MSELFHCGQNHDDGCGGTFSCSGVCPPEMACQAGFCGGPPADCTDKDCPVFPGAEGEGMTSAGGRGGDVILAASESVHSLLRVARAHRYLAKDGRPGGTNQRSGRSADHVRIEVPPGTQVFDAEHGNLLFDLDERDSQVVIVKGGKGGLGNQHFATSTIQVPTTAYPGKPGEKRHLRLELKVIAEVGLLGLARI